MRIHGLAANIEDDITQLDVRLHAYATHACGGGGGRAWWCCGGKDVGMKAKGKRMERVKKIMWIYLWVGKSFFFCWISERHPSVQHYYNFIIISDFIAEKWFAIHAGTRNYFIVCLPLHSFSFGRWRRTRQIHVLNADDVAAAVVHRLSTMDSGRMVFALNCMSRRHRRRSFHSIYH